MAMNNNTLELRMQFLKSIPALLLDDYGVNFGSPWEMSKIDEIMTSRFRDEKITVMTTNLKLTEIPERIVSRFGDSVLSKTVLNEGIDQRPLKKEIKA